MLLFARCSRMTRSPRFGWPEGFAIRHSRSHSYRILTGDKKESWDVIVKPRFKQLSDDVIEGYELNAKASVGLERKFGTNLPYKLISEPELDAFF
jgi:hypothetical protein